MTNAVIVSDRWCGQCAQAITRDVSSVPDVQQVAVDRGTKRVSVEARADGAAETITSAIHEAGSTEITTVNERLVARRQSTDKMAAHPARLDGQRSSRWAQLIVGAEPSATRGRRWRRTN